jgi:hypothetical protein
MPTPIVSGIYHKGNLALAKGEINRLNDTIQVIFLSNAHTINASTHELISDVVAHEVAEISRQTLSGKTIDNSGSSNIVKFDGLDINIQGVTGNFKHVILAKFDTADNNSNSKLLAYWTFADQALLNQDININFNVNGIITEEV